MIQSVTVPACLRDSPQWVAWKSIERDGKPTKSPIDPHTAQFAKSTDASTWGTFDEARDACSQDPGLSGVGFVFTADDPYCGVDLDDCRDPKSGQLKDWARAIVAKLASYSEVSPSGTGIKVFVKASKPGPRCRKAYYDGEIEIYDRDRFFTVTGERLNETPANVEMRQEQLDALYLAVFGDDGPSDASPAPSGSPGLQPSTNGHAHLDDDQIIELASNQRRSGAKFRALWGGDWNAHFNSASEADSSVVFTLAFYTKDAAQIDRLFRRSGLMRPKWDELHGEQTYGQMTVAKALGKVTKQYQPNGKRNRSRPPAPPPTNPGLPSIVVDDTQLSDLTNKVLGAVVRANTPPAVFVRAGTVARVVCDENGLPKVETFDRVRMRCRLSEVANFFTLRKGEDGFELVGTNPPLSLAENVLAQTTWNLPPLAGIARAPILRHDGTICTQPGYDPVSRLMYCPDPGLVLTPIPEHPDGNEVQACMDILLGVISEFPFADEPSRANALAILFSLLMRPVITGHVPLAIVDAPVQGTGKTLLVAALGTIAVGSVASESIPSKQNDDEWRKKITSILLTASPFVLLDNIPDNTTIDSPALAAALTTREWSDRLLGRNDSIRLPSRAVAPPAGRCSAAGCDRPASERGMCHSHARRARRGAPLDTPIGERRDDGPAICTHEGCNLPSRSKGLCRGHYSRSRNPPKPGTYRFWESGLTPEWWRAIRRMAASARPRRVTPWDKWIYSRRASFLQWRPTPKEKTQPKRTTWQAAIRAMCQSWLREAWKARRDPWDRWCERRATSFANRRCKRRGRAAAA